MQKSRKLKIIILSSLFLILLILITIKFTCGSKEDEAIQKDNIKKISYNDDQLKKKIPYAIDSILLQFGIKKEWIKTVTEGTNVKVEQKTTDKTKKDKDKKGKTVIPEKKKLLFDKEISIPADLSVAEVNIDINNYLNEIYCSLTASEDPKNGSVKSEIFVNQDSTKRLIGSLFFIPSKELKRDAADVHLVINHIEDISPQDADIILSSPEKFTIVMPDDIEKSDVQAKIFDSRKDYLLMFDIGSEKDVDADFRSDMKSGEWKAKIKNFCTEFAKSSGIIFSNRRSIPKFESDVKEEFSRYNNNLFSDTIFVKFESKDKPGQKISELIKDIISKNSKGYKTIYYLVSFSAEDLSEYSKQINSLKKQGFRFKVFGDIQKKPKV